MNPDKHNLVLLHFSFTVSLDTSNGSCNTLDYPSGRMRLPNKAEDVNLNAFNIITKINESPILAKHISCDCKYEFDSRKYNSIQKWNKIKS